MARKTTNSGLGRIIRAFGYSLKGLAACYRMEAAFRQEVWLFFILLPVLLLLPVPVVIKLALLAVNILVLLVELLNSALEAIVDKASPDFDPLAGRAKDMGSAAVLLALLIAAATWATALYLVFI